MHRAEIVEDLARTQADRMTIKQRMAMDFTAALLSCDTVSVDDCVSIALKAADALLEKLAEDHEV